jgi:hypothetical protein
MDRSILWRVTAGHLDNRDGAAEMMLSEREEEASMVDEQSGATVSVDKEYEFVSRAVHFHTEKIYDTFKLFIQLSSAIVGGSIALSFQPNISAKTPIFATLSNTLAVLLVTVCCIIVIDNHRAWIGFRRAQSRLGGKDDGGKDRIPGPRPWRSVTSEAAMVIVMIVAAVLFCIFNPFKI